MAARATGNAGAATLAYGSRTDVGLVREHNEDSLLVSAPLFVVADGMGGHEAGEVASEIIIDSMAELAPRTPDAGAMIRAVEAANLNVIKAPRQGIGHEGMGSTLTAAVVQGERLLLAQVGDSRAYLLHNGRLQQLTRDHSLMQDLIDAGRLTEEEARFHPNRSVITRAMGSDPYMQPDIYELNVASGDRLLLCSDGLNAMLEDAQIAQILRQVQNPQDCADKLTEAARAAGGYDNITTIVVDIQGFAGARQRKEARRSRIWVGALVAAVVAVFAAAIIGCQQYVANSAYLGVQDGKVAVYQGLPDEFLGIQLSSLDHVTDITIEDLTSVNAGVAGRIQHNMAVDGLEDANRLIDDYEAQIAAAKATDTAASATDAQPADKATSAGESA